MKAGEEASEVPRLNTLLQEQELNYPLPAPGTTMLTGG